MGVDPLSQMEMEECARKLQLKRSNRLCVHGNTVDKLCLQCQKEWEDSFGPTAEPSAPLFGDDLARSANAIARAAELIDKSCHDLAEALERQRVSNDLLIESINNAVYNLNAIEMAQRNRR